MNENQNNKLARRTLVMKFGGTSVGSTQALKQVIGIVQDAQVEWQRVVVVISALSGVTDLLLKTARSAAEGSAFGLNGSGKELLARHLALADDLVASLARREQLKQEIGHLVAEFSNLCHAISVIGEASPRALDAVAALGERMSVRLLAAALESAGVRAISVEATQLIVTDERFQAAHPDFEATRSAAVRMLEPILSQGIIPVVTGFISASSSGVTTTLGRGGSDYSAALLASVLQADEVWIWTDVDGVMTSDPRLVENARTIPVLSYREVAELAFYGARVLHPKTIRPIIDAGIALRVCNTFNPGHPGTRIVDKHSEQDATVIKAVTAIQGLQLITLEGRGMLGIPGVAARTFAAVAATKTSVPLISQASSEQSICFAVPAESAARVIESLEETFDREIQKNDIDRVWATGEVVIVTVVGAGMIHTPGIAGRIFTALGTAGVNVIAIAQGSSEVSISMVVSAEDTRAALYCLHELIVNNV